MNLPESFTFSQSALQAYASCQFHFYLRYGSNLEWPSAMFDPLHPAELERQAGIRFHQLAQNYFLGVDVGILKAFAEQDAHPQMAKWFSSFLDIGFENITGMKFPELSVNASFTHSNFYGKFDLLVIEKTRIEIFDWKTSNKPMQSAWLRNRAQTRLYPLLARTVFEKEFPTEPLPIIHFTYWEAALPESPIRFLFDQAGLVDAENLTMSTVQEILSKDFADFHKTEHLNHCTYCQFRTYCQRSVNEDYNSDLENELLISFLEQENDED